MNIIVSILSGLLVILGIHTNGEHMINTKYFEGLRLSAYTDTRGYRTIGYGHNMSTTVYNSQTKKSSIVQNMHDKNLLKVRSDIVALYHNQTKLTLEEANQLFNLDMEDAEHGTLSIFPDLYSYPAEIQAILKDMTFNMGSGTLKTFHTFIDYMKDQDYNSAAQDLEGTKWYKQTKTRAQTIVAELRKCADD